MGKYVHTALFWGYMALTLPVLFVPAFLIWIVTFPFDRNGRILHLFTCFWCGQHVWTNPMWRLRVEGKQNVDRKKAYVYACNHQSAGDIAVLFTLFLPFKFVSKHSNFWVPFLGWNMSLNRYVKLKRGDAVSIRNMMNECRAWLGRGVSIMMFPEGTRSLDGKLLPFRGGAFRLAKEAGVPVVPIVIDGSIDALPKDGVIRHKGIVEIFVRIGEPIDSSGFEKVDDMSAAVRGRMEQMQAEIRAKRAPLGAEPARPAGLTA